MGDNREIDFIGQAQAQGAATAGKIANLAAAGGQYGTGPIYSTMAASSPLVLPRALVVVTETPRMYDNNLSFSFLLKTLFESCAKSWSGIDLQYTLDEAGTEIGRDGQSLEMPTKSKRTQPSPNGTWPEYIGNVVWNAMWKWLTDIQDPDTDAIGLKNIIGRDETYDYQLFGLTMFVMQPDMTFQANRLLQSYIITNIWPKTTGELGAKVEMTGTHVPERSINFAGYQIHNADTNAIGQLLWQTMQLETVNYRKLGTGITGVNNNIKNTGLARDIQDVIKATT